MRLITPAPLGSSSWLLRLRSFAVVGQLLTIVLAQQGTATRLPLIPLFSLVALTAVTNLIYGFWLARSEADPGQETSRSQWVAFFLMAIDLVSLTGMLYLTGGADNPFSFFYFVNLAVGAVMLRARSVWTLSALAVVGYTVLLLGSQPVAGLSVRPIRASPTWLYTLDLRDVGLLLAFSTCAIVVTYFVTRTTQQLRDRESDLRRSEAEAADAMRLEGLTTLAAGAAHELATPLSTIDIACRELTCHLEGVAKSPLVEEDLRLIDGQLNMCRQILSRMRSASGEVAAAQWNQTTLGDLIDTTLDGVRDPHRVEVIDPADNPDWEAQQLWLPEEAVAQAVRNLIHNGLDACRPDQTVAVYPFVRSDDVRLEIRDAGEGMNEEVLGRAGDPFFTTKEPGRGIGLGLFLTRNVITRLGGELEFDSQPGRGTTARINLPLSTDPPIHP